MLLKHCIPFVVICSILTVDVANSNGTNEEDPEIVPIDDASCFHLMGVPVRKCEDCNELDVDRSGNVTLLKTNGTLIAFDHGTPFVSKTDGKTNLTFSNEVLAALENREKVSMRFYKNYEDWVPESPDTRSKSDSCARFVDFRCSQTAVISSKSDYERFERLSCRELFGDLIIAGFQFDDNTKYTALESLEKIWGKLVIDRSSGNFHLNFESLTSLSEEIRLDPVLQITRNTLKSIRFPALERIQNFETPANRVVLGENTMFDDSSAMMPIFWKDTLLKSLLPVRMDVPSKSNGKRRKIIKLEPWMTEKYFKKNNIPFKPFRVYRDFFTGYSYVHLAISAVFLLGSCVMFIAGCRRQKENYEFELQATDDQSESEASESEASSSKASSSNTSVFSTK